MKHIRTDSAILIAILNIIVLVILGIIAKALHVVFLAQNVIKMQLISALLIFTYKYAEVQVF